MNFIDPSAKLGERVKVWHFARVLKDAILQQDVSIGSGAEVGAGSYVGMESRIGAGVFLPPRSYIGRWVFIGPNTTFTDDKHPKAGNKMYDYRPPYVEDGACIGAGVVVLPGVRIGANAVVGAGCVVTKDVPAGATVYSIQNTCQK